MRYLSKVVADQGNLIHPHLSITNAGCASMGPGTIGRDRIDYDHAVTASWQRQLLLNLVKLRYGDTPFFLDVASITNSYGLQTQVNLTANWWGNVIGAGAGNSQSLGGAGRLYRQADDHLQPASRPPVHPEPDDPCPARRCGVPHSGGVGGRRCAARDGYLRQRGAKPLRRGGTCPRR